MRENQSEPISLCLQINMMDLDSEHSSISPQSSNQTKHYQQQYQQNHLLHKQIRTIQSYITTRETSTSNPPALLPTTPTALNSNPSRIYCIGYSSDGSYYYTARQDHFISFYDSCDEQVLQLRATVGQWTVTVQAD